MTNAEYKAFVDAGGYERRELWKQPFARDGETLSWKAAMPHFRDSTGRPGPATWILGDYPEGEADHPVRGVSWYEAAAYAEFRGKSLPTLYHWALAALPDSEVAEPLSPAIVPQSNMGGTGPAPVGSHPGISYAGAYDMAGNVYEWVWNAERDRRYLLGGAWSDPGYTVTDRAAESPWRRLPKYGFRCALYTGGEPPETLRAALDLPEPDFYGAPEVPDEVAEAIKRIASYDRTPLNARVEGTIEHPWAREERVTVDAAYGGERLTLFLYLPSRHEAPYQTVVWFPGTEIFDERDTTRWAGYTMDMLRFFLKSGRAVVLPIYAGTLERNDGRTRERVANPNSLRELLFQWRKDLGRTLDYLEEREDFDGDRVAYAGLSLGAAVGPIMLSLEDRFRAAMLWSGGLYRLPTPEGVQNLVDAARRTEVPVLMLNGRYDFSFRVETLQVPMFELLGTPPEHKRHVIYDAGHWPFPRSEFVKENLDWLDRYLGPVEPPRG